MQNKLTFLVNELTAEIAAAFKHYSSETWNDYVDDAYYKASIDNIFEIGRKLAKIKGQIDDEIWAQNIALIAAAKDEYAPKFAAQTAKNLAAIETALQEKREFSETDYNKNLINLYKYYSENYEIWQQLVQEFGEESWEARSYFEKYLQLQQSILLDPNDLEERAKKQWRINEQSRSESLHASKRRLLKMYNGKTKRELPFVIVQILAELNKK